MQRVMKDIVQYKIKSEDLYALLQSNYSASDLQAAKVFDQLAEETTITPKSMSNNVQQPCKPDYCLHLLYRINPENCLQIGRERFYSAFTWSIYITKNIYITLPLNSFI